MPKLHHKIRGLINWKAYWFLLTTSVISAGLVIPYALSLQTDTLVELATPIAVIVIISLLQSTILLAIAILVGIRLSKKLELGFPLIDYFLSKKKRRPKYFVTFLLSIVLGEVVGITIIRLDSLLFPNALEGITKVDVNVLQGFIASFYGGIGEEILLRLFLMTFVVWVLDKSFRVLLGRKAGASIYWLAIVLTSILFGLGHLPTLAALTEPTPVLILRTVLLNGIGGVVFGYLYWKKGLESAMIAHFSADIVLHVIYPAFLKQVV